MENLFNRPTFRNILITLAALLVIFTAAKIVAELKSIQYIGTGVASADTITVSGTGEVLATPDIATFDFTVSQEAMTVADAQKKATDSSNAILAYIKKAGVEDKDVKTLSYTIYPRYDYVGGTVYSSGKQVLAAYVVSQTVEVKVRKLDQAGDLLTGIGGLGATNLSGLTFSVDKEKDLQNQARDKAIIDAKAQAQSLAKSLGVSLVRIVSFNESNNNYPRPVYYAKMDSVGMGTSAVSTPQLPTGENKISSDVTITYEIR